MLIVLQRWLLLFFFPLSFTTLNKGHTVKQYSLSEDFVSGWPWAMTPLTSLPGMQPTSSCPALPSGTLLASEPEQGFP